jgi:hypothetical protein
MSSSQKTFRRQRLSAYLSAPAQLGARDRSIWLSLWAGELASNEAFAHLLRVALRMRVAPYYIAPTPDYRKRRESCRDGANRREFEKTLAKGSRRG